jgi:hypothetical protein
VDIGPNLYFAQSTTFDDSVLPKQKQPTMAAQVLSSGVNPGMKVGLGGMLGIFGAAGVVKLIKRKEEVANHERSE